MPYDAHKNFAYSTIVTPPSPALSGTSLAVAAGEGAKFPAVPFNATVWPAGTALPSTTNAEIVRATARATDTFTITRAQEATTARPIVIGDQIAATITALSLTDIETLVGVTGTPDGTKFLRDDRSWQSVAGGVAYGTTLPGSPVGGQEAILVDPTYQWRFRYNAGSSSAYKWEFVGGTPVIVGIPAAETTTSVGVWVDLATVGPAFTVPRAGDYEVQISCAMTDTTAQIVQVGGGIGAWTSFLIQIVSSCVAGAYTCLAGFGKFVSLTASDQIRVRYTQTGAGTLTALNRVLGIRPIRVS
jgi:hypothetical protein